MIDKHKESFGIILRLVSGLFFAAMVVMIKAVSEDVPLGEIVFFRSAFALIPLIVFLYLRGEFPSGLRCERPWGHILRSVFGVIAMFTSFAAIARLPIAEATLIGYLSPVFLAIAGVILLGERATIFRVIGISLGLAGVVALVWPELGGGPLNKTRLIGLALGVFAAIFTSLALTMTRSMAKSGESPGAIAFYFAITSTLCGLITLLNGHWIIPEIETLFYLIMAGLLGGFAHIAMTLAFKYAETSQLAPFEYVALIWAVLADFFIFGLQPSSVFFIAMTFILAGVVIAAMEQKNKKKLATF